MKLYYVFARYTHAEGKFYDHLLIQYDATRYCSIKRYGKRKTESMDDSTGRFILERCSSEVVATREWQSVWLTRLNHGYVEKINKNGTLEEKLDDLFSIIGTKAFSKMIEKMKSFDANSPIADRVSGPSVYAMIISNLDTATYAHSPYESGSLDDMVDAVDATDVSNRKKKLHPKLEENPHYGRW